MARVCVFVDGENFRHSIVGLFPKFNEADYLPKQAEWTQHFDWITSECSDSLQRIRTYWYVICDLDFFPYGLNNLLKTPLQLRSVLSKFPAYKAELDGLADDTTRSVRMTQIVAVLEQQRERMQNRFNGWTSIQNGISARHDAIEFRRAGAISCELFRNNSLGREKAVDVKLASDLIFLKDIYDVAVIVSGDQDYVPAVQLVKDYGKRVVNVAFEMRGGKLLPGGARRLNQATDWSLTIKHSELASYL